MTSTETVQLRYFGRCPVKGCKHRSVISATSNPNLRQMRAAFGRGDVLVVLDTDGRNWPLHELGNSTQYGAMRHAGLVCPTHNTPVWYVGGRFTYDPEKVCDARCMGAVGPACSCSCEGKNHGGKFC